MKDVKDFLYSTHEEKRKRKIYIVNNRKNRSHRSHNPVTLINAKDTSVNDCDRSITIVHKIRLVNDVNDYLTKCYVDFGVFVKDVNDYSTKCTSVDGVPCDGCDPSFDKVSYRLRLTRERCERSFDKVYQRRRNTP